MKILIIIWIMVITTGIASASYINHEINKNVQEVKADCDPSLPLLCKQETIDIEYARKAIEVIESY